MQTLSLRPHHRAALESFLERYRNEQEFVAILLAGSLAHGYARDDSDIDIILVASDEEYQRRAEAKTLAFSLWDICDYQGGYIDCKTVSLKALRQVAERGSDAARYAFKDAKILHTRSDAIGPILEAITRFPAAEKESRKRRFACQLLAWKWYLDQAKQKDNPYLRHLACQKITLFACRLVLNENGLLYPFHKWLLEETKSAKRQPPQFASQLDPFLSDPTATRAETLLRNTLEFVGIDETKLDWPNQFMADSELNWLDSPPPVDDL